MLSFIDTVQTKVHYILPLSIVCILLLKWPYSTFKLQSSPDFLSIYTASGESPWLLGLSKAAVKVQDHRRKAVNMWTWSWNTALPVLAVTL